MIDEHPLSGCFLEGVLPGCNQKEWLETLQRVGVPWYHGIPLSWTNTESGFRLVPQDHNLQNVVYVSPYRGPSTTVLGAHLGIQFPAKADNFPIRSYGPISDDTSARGINLMKCIL